jgi:hypothetical protein
MNAYFSPAIVATYEVRELLAAASGFASTGSCFEEGDGTPTCDFTRN